MGPVAPFAQVSGKRLCRTLEEDERAVAPKNFIGKGVEPGHQRRERLGRRAALADRVVEDDRLGAQFLQEGGGIAAMPVGGEVVRPKRIDGDQDDVRS